MSQLTKAFGTASLGQVWRYGKQLHILLTAHHSVFQELMTLSAKSLEERLTPASKQVPLRAVLTEVYGAAQNCWCSVCQAQIPFCQENLWHHRHLETTAPAAVSLVVWGFF